ncbi:MAG: hypothetical protein GX181_02875 [Synergistaceae bacterium]|nr:hypothetical protein [Synergistota bacterium]NLM70892.1 hypothetical protein [Synergistaceae bacterium]
MPEMDRTGYTNDTTVDSPLSSLLRSLFLHGVEHCVISGADKSAIFSKEQIVSFMERGHADTKVAEAMKRLSSGQLPPGTISKSMGPLTPVLLVTKQGVEVVPAEAIPDEPKKSVEAKAMLEETPALQLPAWWTVPLPIVLCDEGSVLYNHAAEELFEDIALPKLSKKKRLSGEFLIQHGGRQFLFSRIDPAVFLIQEVTEDIKNADRMAWLASIGQAFITDLKCRRRSVRQVRSKNLPAARNEDRCLACIWENAVLGYVCIDNEPEE